MKKIQSIPYPTYTTAERDALVGVLLNTKINNSDTGKVEEYNGSVWVEIGGGSGASIASNVSVTPPTGYTSTDMQGLSNEFAAAIDLRESIFFDDITVKAKISRPYNFTVSAKTESGGTGTITTSLNAAYTLGATVTANDYVQVAASAVNTRVFLTLTRV